MTDSADGRRVRFNALADEALANRLTSPTNEAQESGAALSYEAISDEARRLNEQLGGWAYSRPSFKTDPLMRRKEDVLKPID